MALTSETVGLGCAKINKVQSRICQFEANLLETCDSCIRENFRDSRRRYPLPTCRKWVFSSTQFFCNRGSDLRKNGNFNPRNSKPEVGIDVVPTAFVTLRQALKYYVITFGQVAPQ